MASGATVRIVGLEELQKKLGADFKPAMRAATKAIAAEIQGKIAPYPPDTNANRPKPPGGRWYERGYGPKWRRMDGSIQGRKTSETLGRRWGIRSAGRTGAAVGNIASYAPYVHSAEEQARFHKRRGWVTDRKAIDMIEKAGTIRRIVEDALMRVLE